MFTKEKVEEVLNVLKENVKFFVSEAHLQMSFTLEAYKKFGKDYDFYPEFPIRNDDKIDEIDLVIVEKSTTDKTFIEFKHKTRNSKTNPLRVKTVNDIEFEPSHMAAQNLGRFDCWSDIERLEKYKGNNEAKNCFFIFITNEHLYLDEDGSNQYGTDFSVKKGDHTKTAKQWQMCNDAEPSVPEDKIKSIGKIRNRKIITKEYSGNNAFNYTVFQEETNHKYSKYWCLIVDVL